MGFIEQRDCFVRLIFLESVTFIKILSLTRQNYFLYITILMTVRWQTLITTIHYLSNLTPSERPALLILDHVLLVTLFPLRIVNWITLFLLCSSQFSLFEAVISCHWEHWISKCWTIAPRRSTSFSWTDQYTVLFYVCCCLNTLYLIHIVDSRTLNSQPTAWV